MVREVLTPLSRRLRRLAVALPLALPACAQTMNTPPRPDPTAPPLKGQTEDAASPRNRCNAAPAQGQVGKKATRGLLEQARTLAGARILRVIGPDEMVTQEYNASRLTVLLDEKGVIAEVRCG